MWGQLKPTQRFRIKKKIPQNFTQTFDKQQFLWQYIQTKTTVSGDVIDGDRIHRWSNLCDRRDNTRGVTR